MASEEDGLQEIPLETPLEDIPQEEINGDLEVKEEINLSLLQRIRKNPHTGLAIVTFGLYVDFLLVLACVPILPIYASELNIGRIGIGAVMSGRSIGTILCNPAMGWASDKFGRKYPMLVGLFGQACATLLFAFSFNFPMLFIARFLQGVASSANITAGMALIADLFPSETRGKKISIALTGLSLGVLSGAPFGGIMFHFGGIRLPFLICAVLIFIDGLARTFLLEEPKRHIDSSSSQKPTIPVWRAFLNLLKDEQIIVVSGALFFGNAGISVMEFLTPLYFTALNFNPLVIGFIYLVSTLTYTLTVPIIGNFFGKDFGRWKVILAGVAIMGISMIVLLIFRPFWCYIIVLGFIGVGMAGVDASCNPELADIGERRHPDSFGKVYAVSSTANGLGFVVGPLLAGYLVEAFGFETTFTAFGIGLCCFAPVVCIVGISQRRERMRHAQKTASSQQLIEKEEAKENVEYIGE